MPINFNQDHIHFCRLPQTYGWISELHEHSPRIYTGKDWPIEKVQAVVWPTLSIKPSTEQDIDNNILRPPNLCKWNMPSGPAKGLEKWCGNSGEPCPKSLPHLLIKTGSYLTKKAVLGQETVGSCHLGSEFWRSMSLLSVLAASHWFF